MGLVIVSSSITYYISVAPPKRPLKLPMANVLLVLADDCYDFAWRAAVPVGCYYATECFSFLPLFFLIWILSMLYLLKAFAKEHVKQIAHGR